MNLEQTVDTKNTWNIPPYMSAGKERIFIHELCRYDSRNREKKKRKTMNKQTKDHLLYRNRRFFRRTSGFP